MRWHIQSPDNGTMNVLFLFQQQRNEREQQILVMEEEIMKKYMKFAGLTVLLIVVLAFAVKGTVTSREYGQDTKDRAVLKQLEQEYIAEVKSLLANSGYENSGVMLNYVKEGDVMYYTITVHHDGISVLNEAEKSVLKAQILALAFELPECYFQQEFLSFS